MLTGPPCPVQIYARGSIVAPTPSGMTNCIFLGPGWPEFAYPGRKESLMALSRCEDLKVVLEPVNAGSLRQQSALSLRRRQLKASEK